MANKERYKFDENQLKPGQREAAIALVEYEFTPKGERKTKEQLAEDLGITRMCLWKWDKRDANFIAYKNYLADQMLDSHKAMVYARLVESIDKRYSVRAMELYMKRAGDLADNAEITINQGEGEGKDFAEQEQALLARLGKAPEHSDKEGEE